MLDSSFGFDECANNGGQAVSTFSNLGCGRGSNSYHKTKMSFFMMEKMHEILHENFNLIVSQSFLKKVILEADKITERYQRSISLIGKVAG